MRICILTQPLLYNYGGILQAYALQATLKRLGHEIWTEDRRDNTLTPTGQIKKLIKRLLSPIRRVYYTNEKQKEIIYQHTKYFIDKYITTTDPISSKSKEAFKKYNFEGYIVGSDQVWRPLYSHHLPNYFLDFAINEKVKRIAYAASFGTSEWEFTLRQSQQCAALAKRFDAISVREDSGVELCKKYLGVDAIHLLDPTMLLEKKDYICLVEQERTSAFKDNLMTYILDQSAEKREIIKNISDRMNLTPIVVMPEKYFHQVGSKHLEKCIFPPVTDWLRGFMDAEYVVTDSFHGAVFSIIFNKPFVVIANKERGMARFTSLLKKFELENRLIYSWNDTVEELIHVPIKYDKVNQIRKREQEKAMNFLMSSLK